MKALLIALLLACGACGNKEAPAMASNHGRYSVELVGAAGTVLAYVTVP